MDLSAYNCPFCGACCLDDDSTCGQDGCETQMTQCVDDYTSLYEAYMTKADEIATPWAASMKEYVEMYYTPHSLPAMAMYEKYTSLCDLYTQLEYMETHTPSTSTHAVSQPTIDALTAQITDLTAQITALQATNSQLTHAKNQLSLQCGTMSTAFNANQEEMRQMHQRLQGARSDNLALLSQVRQLQNELAQANSDHVKVLRKANEDAVNYKVIIAQLYDDIRQSEQDKKKQASGLNSEVARMRKELDSAKSRISDLTNTLTTTRAQLKAPVPSPRAHSMQNNSGEVVKVLGKVTFKPCVDELPRPANGGHFQGFLARVTGSL